MYKRSIYALAAMAYTMATASPTATTVSRTQTTLAIPAGTIVGSILDGVEYYRGIPFAHPPTGSLRLKPPVRLETFGIVQATGIGPACPQMTGISTTPLFLEAVGDPVLAESLFLGEAQGNVTEDCLTISVMRPDGVAPGAKLPVLFWIHGGGFELGSSQPYNGSVLIPRAVTQGKPFILVAVNYRLGGFGFLGGREILAEGSANLGLLDQRMGLEWVADNIAAFGGDPDAVTIWGESAGSFSVFDQLALYDGDNSYNGRPLFRGAIMNSGSILPSEPVDGVTAQEIFDTVLEAAGCSSDAGAGVSGPACLRNVDYETFLNATNSVPSFLSYNSLALSYMPRPDGKILTASPEVLARSGRYAAVPLIIGDTENEGTIFASFQTNATTQDAVVSYLHDIIFHNATSEEIAALVDTYPDSYYSSNETQPEFERLAAILGDVEFTLSRRVFLETVLSSVPAWSFLATWERGTSIFGTIHTADIPRVLYGMDDASRAIQNRYITFVTSLTPNDRVAATSGGPYGTYWPAWQESRQLLEFGANATGLIKDDFRAASFEFIKTHLDILHY